MAQKYNVVLRFQMQNKAHTNLRTLAKTYQVLADNANDALVLAMSELAYEALPNNLGEVAIFTFEPITISQVGP